MGRPLIPPAWLIRSTAIWVPTRAVIPPAAAEPVRGWRVPILYGFAWPKAARHGAGTKSVAPRAPAARALQPRKRRRVVRPDHHISRAHGASCHRSAIARASFAPRARGPGGADRGDTGDGRGPLPAS